MSGLVDAKPFTHQMVRVDSWPAMRATVSAVAGRWRPSTMLGHYARGAVARLRYSGVRSMMPTKSVCYSDVELTEGDTPHGGLVCPFSEN